MSLAELGELPTVVDLVTAGRALGLGRTKTYELAQAGEFHCRITRAGKKYLCPPQSCSPCPDTSRHIVNRGASDQMASGRFKRCICRDVDTGRRLGTKCPKPGRNGADKTGVKGSTTAGIRTSHIDPAAIP
jgi:hypothetical protein